MEVVCEKCGGEKVPWTKYKKAYGGEAELFYCPECEKEEEPDKK